MARPDTQDTKNEKWKTIKDTYSFLTVKRSTVNLLQNEVTDKHKLHLNMIQS